MGVEYTQEFVITVKHSTKIAFFSIDYHNDETNADVILALLYWLQKHMPESLDDALSMFE